MPKEYAVISCRNTMDLFKRHAGNHGVYIPIERVRKVDKRGIASVKQRAAIPGVAFVPVPALPEFLRQCEVSIYSISRMITPGPQGRWILATLEELIRMQSILNSEFEEIKNPLLPDEDRFEVGDVVEVVGVPGFAGQRGTVQKVRRNGKVRLSLDVGGIGYVELSKNFVTLCN